MMSPGPSAHIWIAAGHTAMRRRMHGISTLVQTVPARRLGRRPRSCRSGADDLEPFVGRWSAADEWDAAAGDVWLGRDEVGDVADAAERYALIGSAKLNGLDPTGYLRFVLERIAHSGPLITQEPLFQEDIWIASAIYNRIKSKKFSAFGGDDPENQANQAGGIGTSVWVVGPARYVESMTSAIGSALCTNLTNAVRAVNRVFFGNGPVNSTVTSWKGVKQPNGFVYHGDKDIDRINNTRFHWD